MQPTLARQHIRNAPLATVTMAVSIAAVTTEHHHDGFGLAVRCPRLSWRFNATTAKDWHQASYDLKIERNDQSKAYHVDSAESVLVPWPSHPLQSRERATVGVRSTGVDGSQTDWAELLLEAALLERSDWKASLISGPKQSNDSSKKPFRLRKSFSLSKVGRAARLYATAHGIYEVEINGKRVGDHQLAPGFQTYKHRLHYQIYDVTSLLQEGENIFGAYLAEGWFAGRLGRPSVSNIWGDRLGFLAQLECDGEVACLTDSSWEWLDGPIQHASIYDGEVYDSNQEQKGWSAPGTGIAAKGPAEELPFPSAALIAPEMPPMRKIMEVKPVELIKTPSGKLILDFGQNLVGWLRIEKEFEGKPDQQLFIRHAEVLEQGELGVRPLRTAKAQNTVTLGGKVQGYEPRFTFFGFRYVSHGRRTSFSSRESC